MDTLIAFSIIILIVVTIFVLLLKAGESSNNNSTHKTNPQTTSTRTKIDKLTNEAKTHLASDEEIIAGIEGLIGTVILTELTYGDLPAVVHKNKTIDEHNGILLATTSRVVIYKPKRRGSEIKFVSYSNISGIETEEKWIGYSLVFSAEETIVVKHIDKELAKAVNRVTDYIKSRMGESTEENKEHTRANPTTS